MQKHVRKEMLADFCCAVGYESEEICRGRPFKQVNEFLFYLKVNIKPLQTFTAHSLQLSLS